MLESNASNLVAADTNGKPDVFLRNLWQEKTTRISVADDGRQVNGSSTDPSISADGQNIVFVSNANFSGAAIVTDLLIDPSFRDDVYKTALGNGGAVLVDRPSPICVPYADFRLPTAGLTYIQTSSGKICFDPIAQQYPPNCYDGYRFDSEVGYMSIDLSPKAYRLIYSFRESAETAALAEGRDGYYSSLAYHSGYDNGIAPWYNSGSESLPPGYWYHRSPSYWASVGQPESGSTFRVDFEANHQLQPWVKGTIFCKMP